MAAAPPTPEGQQPPSSKNIIPKSWGNIRGRATTVANITGLFVFLLVGGGLGGYFYSQSKKPVPETPKTTVESLSAEDLQKLNEIGANLGTTGQVLNIGADALFRGKASVTGDLTIGGRLNANGPVTLSQLNITGTTAATGLSVGSNLSVTGTTNLQQAVTISNLLTVNGGLTVTGAASIRSVNADTIAVRSLSISGPIVISHLVTQGPSPNIAANNVGGGGTVSISGNDTTGTVNINTGGGPGNVLATVTFRSAYGNTVHVMLTPLSPAAADAGAYVTRTNTGFQIHANTPPAGQVLSFDYLVTQ